MKLRHRIRAARKQAGFTMPAVLSVMIAASILSLAVVSVILNNFFVVGNNIKSQQAFNIAEAGINYYLWHLSHNPTDYKDGKNTPAQQDPELGYGPYVHNYVDDNAKTTGTYTLWIKPRGGGSTIVDVRSIGKVKNTTITRTVEAQIGAASFASYSLAADTALWFGSTESATGPVHSNVGIRMDGASDSDVTSANATYVPPFSLGGDGASHPGVWCHPSILTPVNCNTRSKTDWRYPVPSVDFNQVSSTLCAIKKEAFASSPATAALASQASACSATPASRSETYLPRRASTFNVSRGYLIELNTDGTYNLYNVNGENDRLTPYTSALTLQSVQNNIAIASTGVIFAEDNVWVRTNPTFHGRVTIAAGRLSTTSNANVVIADDVLYSTKNGQDAIGLIAEDSVIIAPYAPPASGNFNFEINAASLAQSGSVIYPNEYRTDADRCTRGWSGANQNFTYYGSVASRQTWTWTWSRGSSCPDAVSKPGGGYVSGILNNSTQYDYNLLYAPPPSYPITGGYNILSWREVLTRP
jgi:Tfp pilus assembly protein PilX